jgi:hypothetical protein
MAGIDDDQRCFIFKKNEYIIKAFLSCTTQTLYGLNADFTSSNAQVLKKSSLEWNESNYMERN